MGILDMFENVEVPEEVEVLDGNLQEKVRERFAPIMAKPEAEDFYHMYERNLNFKPGISAGSAGVSGFLHRHFGSPVTGDNFGKMDTGAIVPDPLFKSDAYDFARYFGDMRFDADAVNNARRIVEQRPGINKYHPLDGNNCIDFSMGILDEMMRQKTGEGIGWN